MAVFLLGDRNRQIQGYRFNAQINSRFNAMIPKYQFDICCGGVRIWKSYTHGREL